jgi:hypothetical protein
MGKNSNPSARIRAVEANLRFALFSSSAPTTLEVRTMKDTTIQSLKPGLLLAPTYSCGEISPRSPTLREFWGELIDSSRPRGLLRVRPPGNADQSNVLRLSRR